MRKLLLSVLTLSLFCVYSVSAQTYGNNVWNAAQYGNTTVAGVPECADPPGTGFFGILSNPNNINIDWVGSEACGNPTGSDNFSTSFRMSRDYTGSNRGWYDISYAANDGIRISSDGGSTWNIVDAFTTGGTQAGTVSNVPLEGSSTLMRVDHVDGVGNASVSVTFTCLSAVAGVASISSTACEDASTSVTLTLAGYTGFIQWQESTVSAAGPFTDVVGATTDSEVVTPATTTWYQAVVTSCGTSLSNVVQRLVNPAVTLTLTDDAAVTCEAPFNLSGASPAGGFWSGPGVTDGVNGTFDPALAGVGSHTINYNYSDGTCSALASDVITVTADITPPVAVCQDLTVNLDATGNASVLVTDYDGGSTDDCGIVLAVATQTAFTCSDVGAVSVTVTVQDGAGNNSDCTSAVTVQDVNPPTALCQSYTVNLDGSGNGVVTGADIDGGSSDACGIASLSASPSTFNCGDIGSTTTTLTVTDNNGLTAMCTANLTIQDILPPVAVCQDITVQLDASGNQNITGADIDGGSSDNCGISFLTPTANSFNCGDVGGPISVDLIVLDNSAQAGSCTALVTVEDNIAPTALCQDLTVQLDATGAASILAGDIDAGSNDACGIGSLTVSVSDFTCSEIGANTVVLTVEDANGNTSTCSATVEVEDNIDPVITCAADVSVSTDPGLCSANVTVPAPLVTDNCGAPLNNSSFAGGSGAIPDNSPGAPLEDNLLISGTSGTIVSLTVSVDISHTWVGDLQLTLVSPAGTEIALLDRPGVPAGSFGCSDDDFSITFDDASGFSDADLETRCGFTPWYNGDAQPIDALAALAGEDLDGTWILRIADNASGDLGTLNSWALDVEFANARVTRNRFERIPAANRSLQLDLSEHASRTAADKANATPVSFAARALVTLTNSYNGTSDASDVYPVGTTTITWTATDTAGNTATCTQDVTVTDNEVPSVTCVDATVQLDATGSATVSVGDVDGGSTDNCGVASSSLDITGFDCTQKGDNAVVLSVFDAEGNVGSCTATVTVEDNVAPMITCGADITQSADIGSCSALVTVPGPIVMDNCDDTTGISTVTSGNAPAAAISNILPPTCDAITVPGTGGSVIDVEIAVDLSHTWISDLILTIESPDGTVLTLADFPFCADDDLVVSFSDAATATNGDLDAECTGSFTPLTPFPASGSYQPQDALAGLIGQTAAGDWTLCITDGAGGDDGTLNSWSITLTSSGIGSRGVETLTFSSSSRADEGGFDYTSNQSDSRADKEAAAQNRSGNTVNGIAMRGLLSVTNDFNGTDDASGVYPVGTTPVVWTVTDEEGNSATCTQLVTVTDDEAPVALCQDLTVQLDGTGNATIAAGDVDNGSSDNCAVTSLALDVSSFNCGDVGNNTVILTAEDAAGNTGSCTAIVTVEDNEAPVLAACPANITQSSSPTACGLNVTFTLPTATDNCAGTVVTSTAPSGTFFPVGLTTVTVTATDPSGNTDDCTFDITIIDDVSPIVICPANVTVAADAGRCENEVSWITPTASDNCPGVSITSASHLPGETFPVGTTTVTYEASDATGNTGSCSFTVTVTDDEDPVVTCTDVTIYLDNAGAVSITEADVVASATDNCGVIDTTLSQASFDCSEVGGNGVTVTVEDASGNTGTCVATVTVLDTLAPTALCQDVTVMLDGSGNGSITAGDVDGGSSDNCAIASLSIDISSFTCSDVGSNTATLTVTDVNGNSSTCTANVEVEDNIAPTASCTDVTVALDGSGTASITAGDVDNGSSDNCGVASVTLDQTTFTCADIGSNTVTLTVTDVNGNTSACTADVSVFDNTAPIVTCTDVTVYLDATGSVSIAIGDVGSATDNCSIGSQTITQSSFDCDETGDNDVIYNAIDDEGNVGSCTATVTVLDTIPPTITCPADIVVDNDPGVCEAFVNVPTPAFNDNCGDAGGGGGITNGGNTPGTATVDNSTICDVITIAADPSGVVNEVTVSVDISHTWVGDLTVTLESPDGSTVTLLDRPGIDPPATCCGCSNDNLDIDFADGVGLDAASLEALCSGSDPWYSGAAQPVELLATFAGDAVDGDWTLCVSDGAGGDGGFLNSWSIEIDYGTARVAAASDLTGQRRMPIDRGAVASTTLADKQLAQMMDQARRGIVSLTNDYNGTDDASDVYPLGTTTVTWTATDESGNTTTCTMDVTVNDTEAPVLTCNDYTFPNDPGLCEATISVPAPVVTDNCDDFNNGSVGSSAPGSAISNSLGVPTCDAITISGSTGSVVDVQVSVDVSHTWIGDLDISLQSPDGSTVTLLDRPGVPAGAFGCSDDDLVIDFSDGAAIDAATLDALCDGNTPWYSGGAQPVTLFATLSGESVNGDWTLCVNDNAGGDDGVLNSWSISIDDGSTRIAASSATGNDRVGFSYASGASATRITASSTFNNERTSWNYRANASASEADKGQGSTPMNAMRRGDVTLVNDFNGLDNITDEVFPVGTTVIVWTATDSSGNVGSCTSTVTVEDVEPPVVTCQDITVYLDASGSVSISDADVTASVTDNCAVGSGTVTPSSFDCNDTGDNTVVLEILDASGNVGSCSATVTVLDSIPPVITCPADITVSNDIGSCSAVVSFADPTVTDNCEAGSPVPVTLSQSVDNTTITTFNSISCNAGGLHADNSYIRVYDLASEGVTDEFTLTSVDFGVETASSAGGSQPVTVNIYTLPAATPLTFANLTLVSTAAASVADGSAFIQNVPVSATIPAGSIMVVELFTPDGQGVGNSFFIGSNAAGETSTSYLAAASCSIFEPTDVTTIGFPGMNIILDVNGEEAPAGAAVTITQIEGLPSGSVFPVGTTTNTFVAEDESGNTDTCSFVITVEDTEDPVAVCQDITVQLDATGNVSITGADIDGGSTDNCAIASLTAIPSAFTCAEVGDNAVELIVTDVNGNSGSCTATVTVEDNIPPTVLCMDATVYLDATGNVTITTATVDAGTTDNCGIGSLTVSPSSFDCDETGSTTVTLSAIDDNGNTGSCTAEVTVLDTIPPTITCPADITVSNDPGVCEAFVTVPVPMSDDNCGSGTATLTNDFNGTDNASGVYPEGTTTVTWTITDASGNSTSCTMDVTVNDIEAPELTCTDYSFDNDPGECGATVSVPAPIITDNCDDFDNGTVGSSAPASAISNSLGVPTCDAISISGSTGSVVDVQVSVDVSHTWVGDLDITLQSPDGSTITLLDRPGYAGSGFGCLDDDLAIDFSDAGTTDAATLEAICDGNTPWFSGSAQPVTLFATLAGEAVNGDWTLCVTDNAGGDDGTFNSWSISIDDGTTRIAASSAVNNERTAWNYRDAESANDAEKLNGGPAANAMRRGEVTLTNDFNGLDNITDEFFPVGTTVVVWTATDSSGNVGSCTSTITVEDNEPPVVVCQDITVYLDASGSVSITDGDVTASATDNCGIGSATVTPSSFDCDATGDNSVVLEVLDVNGNVGSCSATVTVLDTIPPMITCPADITVSNDIGSCSASVSVPQPIVDDNCLDFIGTGTSAPGTATIDNNTICDVITIAEDPTGAVVDVAVSVDISHTWVGDLAITLESPDGSTITLLDRPGVPTGTFGCSDDDVIIDFADGVGLDAATLESTCDAIGGTWYTGAAQPVQLFATLAGETLDGDWTLCVSDGAGGDGGFLNSWSIEIDYGTARIAATSDLTGQRRMAIGGAAAASASLADKQLAGMQVMARRGDVTLTNSYNGTDDASDVYPVGTTVVTWTATDESGNTATCDMNITVEDTEDPIAVCQDVTVQLDASGNATITAADVDGGSTDNCSIETSVVDPSSFTCADIGSNTVTLTVTDPSGNTGSCTATVDVEDNLAPTVTCTDITVYLDETGSVSIAIGDVGSATDNCSIGSQTISQSSFDCDETGDNDVIYNAIDFSGNIGSCTATVTVLDTIAPMITCPADITVSNDPGVCEAFVTVPLPMVDDNCGPDVTCTPVLTNAGSTVGGPTWDRPIAGGPSISGLGPVNYSTYSFTAAATGPFDFSSTQSYDGYLHVYEGSFDPLNQLNNLLAGNDDGFGGIGTSDITGLVLTEGTTYIVVTSGFAAGDVGTFTTTITVPCPRMAAVERQPYEGYNGIANIEEAKMAWLAENDVRISPMNVINAMARRGDITLTNSYNGTDDASDVYPVGTTVVTWTATDESGNSSSCDMSITVEDTEAPIAVCQDVTVQLDASGNASITAGDVDGGSTDNCEIGSLTVTPSSFTCADVGSNTVTLTVTDVYGNAGSCTATVLVEDNIAPIMDCPTDIELTANNIGCSAIVFWDDDIATDNCPAGLVVESNYEPGDVFPLGTTTVTYTATDASGNSSSCSFDVTVINDLTITVDSVFDVSCNGGDDGEIYVTISGGTPPYIPRWSNDLDTEDIENLVPGGYVLFVEDANGCTAITDVIIVDEPTPIVETAPAVVTDASCDGGSMGSIDISYGGGTPPYTYAWSNGATTEDVFGLMAGTYQVTITDANGCELLSPVYSISAPSGAAIGVVSVTDVDCNGAATGEIAITVTGGTPPYSFLWSNSSSDEDLTGIPAGDYTVTVTDALGCSFVSDVITVDEPTAIAVSNVEIVDAACNGEASGSIEIDVDGGTPPYTYFWSNGATTQDIDGLVAGTYTGTITDANGCVVVSPPLTIGEPSAVFVATVDVTDAACNGEESGSIDIEIAGGTGPYLVFWDNGVAAEDLTGVGSGTYSATIFDNNGCQINTGPIDVGQPTAIEITFVDIMFNACNGDEMGSIDIEVAGGTGPYTYLWSNGETTEDISGLAAGDYQGTITDANGCVLVSPVLTVGEASAIEEVSAVVTNPTCNTTTDGGIDITLAGGTAPYSVVWSDGSTDEDLSGVGSGTYSYVVTDANGCVFTSSDFELANPDEVAADFAVTDVSCLGDNSGSITVDVTGGTAPYTYLWSNGETTEDLAGLAAGDYSVVITDANGCTFSSDVFTITEPATALTATIDATNESFLGAQDGSVTVVPDGGDAPYTFEWNTGDITQNLDNVSAGIYCVDITDANGCVIEVCITVGVGTPVIDVFEITDLNLYPNPTMSVANLVVSFSKAVDLEVELVDVLGRVLEARSASQVEEEQFVFDVRDLPAATYFIRLNADGEVRTLPLIVQH